MTCWWTWWRGRWSGPGWTTGLIPSWSWGWGRLCCDLGVCGYGTWMERLEQSCTRLAFGWVGLEALPLSFGHQAG
ncbi:hypothetical protein B0H67DRAFT_581268 [Lasiosphaeris hirsuta]|uniref:Secreted protein n=1 Tax=Lasiosphaeris hirsuta TaxID=260670 RepID=A0AA40DW28_9PEZI|nr:hypothetical protein B0H67DRAFT_581268 [Lasiosphaeris hirsuta]